MNAASGADLLQRAADHLEQVGLAPTRNLFRDSDHSRPGYGLDYLQMCVGTPSAQCRTVPEGALYWVLTGAHAPGPSTPAAARTEVTAALCALFRHTQGEVLWNGQRGKYDSRALRRVVSGMRGAAEALRSGMRAPCTRQSVEDLFVQRLTAEGLQVKRSFEWGEYLVAIAPRPQGARYFTVTATTVDGKDTSVTHHTDEHAGAWAAESRDFAGDDPVGWVYDSNVDSDASPRRRNAEYDIADLAMAIALTVRAPAAQ
ncbi:hypothetical protein [Streptomyces sp. NRRL S-1868]|uniref:hypothetical protein n=1 Tax=Streptomyces sp. NRRL S-1868 TaxID=1463892 RepID=UPI0004C6EE74|nr:hypothetical protein [Streptomyces sp. NRRL S-1868]